MEIQRKPDIDGFNKRTFVDDVFVDVPVVRTESRTRAFPLSFVVNRVFIFSVIALFFILVGSVGAYSFYQKYSYKKTEEKALAEQENGNYAAALSLLSELGERRGMDENPELKEKIDAAKKLFVAEENFLKAQKAAEEERWLDVKILLSNSEAINNPEFKLHKSALVLLKKAQGLVDSYEKEVSATISDLKKNIQEEENRRKQIEKSNAQVSSALQEVSSQKKQTEDVLQSTRSQLNQVQNQAAATQGQLEQERLRAEELAREAEQEKLRKLSNEMWIYVEMLRSGNAHLNSAITEIERSNDVAAFTYISRARDLFNDAKEKATDLYNNRTPYAYQETVNNIIKSANKFGEACQSFSKAVINVSNKDSEEFSVPYDEGKKLKLEAYQLTNTIPVFN